MMVKIKSLDFGGPFVAEVKSGSVALGRIELIETGATYLWQPKSGKWLDAYAAPEFNGIEFEITEVEDQDYDILKNMSVPQLSKLSKGLAPKVNPTPLMEIIGNIPAGDWSKISAMANEDIRKGLVTFGLQPVNKAQVIRCLYAFERYARETGLITSPGGQE